MPEEKSGFTVKDRRAFAEKDEDVKNKEAQNKPLKQEAKEVPRAVLPEINFATFIISLNASALLHLGVMEDPAISKKAKNLPLGKQTIDILGMIEEKTKGNLSKEEKSLLKNILYDLRMIYVKEQK